MNELENVIPNTLYQRELYICHLSWLNHTIQETIRKIIEEEGDRRRCSIIKQSFSFGTNIVSHFITASGDLLNLGKSPRAIEAP